MKKKNIIMSLIGYIFLLFMSIIFILPMLFTILSSFIYLATLTQSLKTKLEIFTSPFGMPKVIQWGNYIQAWKDANMSAYFMNSLIQSGATVILTSIVATMAAYAFARFEFKLNKFLVVLFLLGMMVPIHTILGPISYIIGIFNLKNNIVALVLVYVAFNLPFSIMVMITFMKGVNRSLEEAAIIDGASYFQIYSKIMIPLTLPAISTISIFNFMGAWNKILFPLLFINDKKLRPISLGLLNFSGERGSEYGLLMAGIVITVVVPLAIYLLFQEKVESGLAAGAVKE